MALLATDYIILEDSRRLALRDLPDSVPSSSFMSDRHVAVCRRLASDQELSEALRPVYLNLLVTQSRRARELTALATLIDRGELAVRTLVSSVVSDDFVELLGGAVAIERRRRSRRPALIDRSRALRFVAKGLVHRLYRLVRRRPLTGTAFVRAWVDTTELAFGDEVRSATRLLYPFGGSPGRQLRYALACKRAGRAFSAMGIPYRLSDLAGIALRLSERDRRIAGAEHAAFAAHAEELQRAGVGTLFATDEFDAAAHVLHGALRASGVACINRAHGIAVYGPHVSYTRFHVLSQRQRAYYARYGDVETFAVGSLAADGPTAGATPSGAPVAVFVLGNWRRTGKRYEAHFEAAMLP
ncbi:MAG: hypothetical protein AAGD86_03710, partial [Pseudomonadota bacterium]